MYYFFIEQYPSFGTPRIEISALIPDRIEQRANTSNTASCRSSTTPRHSPTTISSTTPMSWPRVEKPPSRISV